MTDTDAPAPSEKAFTYRSFRLFWYATVCTTFAVQIMSISVGWQIYDITRNPLFLGYIGLAQFLPSLLLVLVTGLAADHFSRRGIMAICLSVEMLCALGLTWIAFTAAHEVGPIYVILVCLGVARAFLGTASASLAPNLVPKPALSNAVTLNMAAWQTANIAGPMAGGLLYGVGGFVPYATAACLIVCSITLILQVPKPAQRAQGQRKSLREMLAGFHFIWSHKLVLGAISLDLFAVLLGGAVALMPVYARDILEVGPWGLGMLRAAPSIGAIVIAIIVTRIPIRSHAGMLLLFFVAGFGLFNLIFGYSTTVWLSVLALALAGGCDMVSVVIRETLMQLHTPDDVRGRVNAVNMVFIGASNELGEFRAGVVAAKWGTVFAVTMGGAGTIMVAALWGRMFPSLRKAQSLSEKID